MIEGLKIFQLMLVNGSVSWYFTQFFHPPVQRKQRYIQVCVHPNKIFGKIPFALMVESNKMWTVIKGMSKKSKPKKRKIKIFFRDGKCDIIPQRLWDDYEVNNGLFVVKKDGAWIAFYQIDEISCMVVG